MSSSTGSGSAGPGWYPDPTMANTQRYWNGEAWTDQVAPGAPMPAAQSDQTGLIVAGYVMAVFIPVGGFIAGLFVKRTGHQAAIIAISVVSLLLVFSLLFG